MSSAIASGSPGLLSSLSRAVRNVLRYRPSSNSPCSHSSRQPSGARFLRNAKPGAPFKIDRLSYEAQHGVVVAELKDLAAHVQRELLTAMSEMFCAEWRELDSRFRTAERAYEELEKQMNSTDPYDVIFVSFRKSNDNGIPKYELISTASMARRDNLPIDTPSFGNDPRFDGWLVNVFTPLAHRRKGHAMHLIGEVAAQAEDRKRRGRLPHFDGFHLYAEPENVVYYERMGFGIVEPGYACIA